MKSKKLLTLLAAAGMASSANAASILLGGYDGTQTQNAIAPATSSSNTGVRQLTGAQARRWRGWRSHHPDLDRSSDQQGITVEPSLRTSTSTGNWGLTDFTTDAQTGAGVFVVTQQTASWINYEITNTGTGNVVLDKLHFATSRTNATTALTQITIILGAEWNLCQPGGPERQSPDCFHCWRGKRPSPW